MSTTIPSVVGDLPCFTTFYVYDKRKITYYIFTIDHSQLDTQFLCHNNTSRLSLDFHTMLYATTIAASLIYGAVSLTHHRQLIYYTTAELGAKTSLNVKSELP